MRNLQKILSKRGCIYDVILMFSGGKDSTMVLIDLIEQYTGIKILAITYNDGYLSDIAKENILHFTHKFQVDQMTLNLNISSYVNAFLASNLVKTVDLCTFTEVFQNIFWDKIHQIALMFGNIPVITGNIGYFSSELCLQDQHNAVMQFLATLDHDLIIPVCDNTFISYWLKNIMTRILRFYMLWDGKRNQVSVQSIILSKKNALN